MGSFLKAFLGRKGQCPRLERSGSVRLMAKVLKGELVGPSDLDVGEWHRRRGGCQLGATASDLLQNLGPNAFLAQLLISTLHL